MELGDTPDIIHPNRKRQIMTGQHPYAGHPAISPEQAKKLATSTYKSTMGQVQNYTGAQPRTRQHINAAAIDMFATLQSVMEREAPHREELEKLAVQTVLRMPEFKSLLAPVRKGEFKIEAHLSQPDLERAKMSDEPEDEDVALPGHEVPEIKRELDASLEKRRFINAMIQGAAITNNYAFAYYAEDGLEQIDPSLVRDYGKLMSFSELGYWAQDDEVIRMAASAHGSEAQGGSEEFTHDENGIPTVIAHGLTFPMLIHELVKGLMEFLSFEDNEDPEVRKHVYSKADFIDEETWQMIYGPAMWKQFLASIGDEGREVVPYLYDEIVQMPIGQFNALMKGMIEGTPQARQQFQHLAAKAKADIAQEQEESQAGSIAKNLLDE